jgi:hypothetical protein
MTADKDAENMEIRGYTINAFAKEAGGGIQPESSLTRTD